MAKKRETKQIEAFQFKPGQSGNPNGRPKIPPEIKRARKLNQLKVAEILNSYASMSELEFDDVMKDPETDQLELMIAGAIKKAKAGEFTALNFILDRMIGKVTDKVEHKLPRPTVIKLIGEDAAIVLGNETEGDE